MLFVDTAFECFSAMVRCAVVQMTLSVLGSQFSMPSSEAKTNCFMEKKREKKAIKSYYEVILELRGFSGWAQPNQRAEPKQPNLTFFIS